MTRYLLILIGIISILIQVILLREIIVLFNGIELVYILALSFWLLGSSLGVYLGRKAFIPSYRTIISFFILFIFLVSGIFLLLRGYKVFLDHIPGSYLEIGEQFYLIALTIFPTSIFTGLFYQWGTKIFISTGKSLRSAYGYESFGGVVGGLISTFAISFGIQTSHLFLFVILLIILSLLFLYGFRKISSAKVIFLIMSIIAIIYFAPEFNNVLSGWNHPYSVSEKDTPFGRLNLDKNSSQFSIFNNDAVVYNSESIIPEEVVQVGALFDSTRNNCLLLSDAGFDYQKELIRANYKQIIHVESNSDLVDLFYDYNINNPISSEDNYKLIIQDPRTFLRNSKRYNAIFLKFSSPLSVLTNRFYTKEFYSECAEHLRDNGILVFALVTSENILTDIQRNQIQTIHSTLSTAFNNIKILKGMSTIFIASKAELNFRRESIRRQSTNAFSTNKLVSEPYIEYIFNNDRTEEIGEITTKSIDIINSDLLPICFQYGNMNWLSKYFPSLINIESFLNIIKLSLKTYLIITLIWFSSFYTIRKSGHSRFSILAFSAGFIGAVEQGILVIHYQTIHGDLYQYIGLLLTVFMLGLVIGVVLFDKIINSFFHGNKFISGFAIIMLNIIFLLSLYYLFLSSFYSPLLIFLIVLFGSIFSSLLFSYSSFIKQIEDIKNVQPVLGADLLGGFGGYLSVSLLLIPFLGVLQTILLLIIFTISQFIVIHK